jgi:hypothetical protein
MKHQASGPLYVQVGDKRFSDERFWRDPEADVYLSLMESDQVVPQESSAQIHITGEGECCIVSVYVGFHCFGEVLLDDLSGLIAAQRTRSSSVLYAPLYLESGGTFEASGAELVWQDGRLSAWIGRHCFGVADPEEAHEFLRRAGVRLHQAAAENVVNISMARLALARRGCQNAAAAL